MKWAPIDNRPVTTQQRIFVANSQGQEGYVRIRWVAGNVQTYGPVLRYPDDAILDSEPQIVSSQDALTEKDWGSRAQELYDKAEKSGADYTRRSTVRRKLIAEGCAPEQARQLADAIPLPKGDYSTP